jgi:hypothetical protein
MRISASFRRSKNGAISWDRKAKILILWRSRQITYNDAESMRWARGAGKNTPLPSKRNYLCFPHLLNLTGWVRRRGRGSMHRPSHEPASPSRPEINLLGGSSQTTLLIQHDVTPALLRYDAMGLVWLLRGRSVVALTSESAAIENRSGAICVYRRYNKPALGPLGDSLEDLDP